MSQQTRIDYLSFIKLQRVYSDSEANYVPDKCNYFELPSLDGAELLIIEWLLDRAAVTSYRSGYT